jgi:hypothetical protein
MKHALSNMTENMHGLLESMFAQYARELREKYPNRTIRKEAVFASAIQEFERRGFIELVDARAGIPNHVPEFLVATIKRAKPPIWIPGKNFPHEPFDLFAQMKPSLQNNEVIWKHIPSGRWATLRTRMSVGPRAQSEARLNSQWTASILLGGRARESLLASRAHDQRNLGGYP